MREVQEKLFDDLLYKQNEEKVEAGETVPFSLDGQDFTIDLTNDNAEAFREAMRPFVEAAAPVTKRSGGGSKKKGTGPSATPAATSKRPTSSAKDSDEENQRIREWAKAQGFELSDRGRLPKHVRDAWAAAQHDGGDNGSTADVTFDRLTDEQPPVAPTFDAVEESGSASQDVDERV